MSVPAVLDSQNVGSQGPSAEPHVFLLGQPPIGEYLGFLVQASPGQNVDIDAAAQRWRQANTVLQQRASVEAGMADNQTVGTIPNDLQAVADMFMTDPAVAASYPVLPRTVGLVELDRLVVFQKQINLTYADQLQQVIHQQAGDNHQLFDFCVGRSQPRPPIVRIQSNQNTYTFQSLSNDARFLNAALLDATQIMGYVPQGYPSSAIVLFVGYGVNALNVVNLNGRLILNNGSHRAYALRASGVTHAFALVQQASSVEELAAVAVQVRDNPGLYIQTPRPPMLKDYFDPELHEIVQVPPKARQIRVQFGKEESDVPVL